MTEESLFEAALEKAAGAEREAFLDDACGGDARLRGRVDRLLAADGQSRGILEEGPGDGSTGGYESEASAPGAAIGPYKLVEVIGEGGMGTVWLAEQSQPVRRRVALKVIKAGMDTRQVVARFEAERQALALMDHPNIAQVLDGGVTPDGRPYFVMELVRGVPITKYCDERRLTPRRRLDLFVPVCQAIQHAHQKGIIHRDIKPSNVLVAEYDDRPLPKVIDFGVAKAAGPSLTEKTLVTGLGVVVGTPEYMSPEQAALDAHDVDTRSDVYSLGVLLYELLTGTTPIDRGRFRKAAVLEMLRLVREEEPPRPSTRLSSAEGRASIAAVRGGEPDRLAKDFRGELDWVVMKALEKDRARRYETANALARDVQRFLADEVVEARPPSAGYRVRKFARKHQGTVAAGGVILLALAAALGGAVYGVVESRNQRVANGLRGEAELAREAAEKARDGEAAARAELFREKERLAAVEYGRTMQVVLQAWRDNNLPVARQLLADSRKDLRGWEWHHLHRLCHADRTTFARHGGAVRAAVFSPDGSLVLTAGQDNAARVWDARTGTQVYLLDGHAFPVTQYGTRDDLTAAFSPDGSRIVAACGDHTARVWNAQTGQEVAILRGHVGWLTSVAFSPDGSKVVTAGLDGTARVWEADTGNGLRALEGHDSLVLSAAFSPDGRRVVTAGLDGTARVWFADTGKQQYALRGHKQTVMSAVFSRDGSLIATAGVDRTAQLWNADTGVLRHILRGHSGHINLAAFNPDGTRVVTASDDGTARVWDSKSGNELHALTGHTRQVNSAAFSPDGGRIATASNDATVRVWDATTAGPLQVCKGHTTWVNVAAFNPDGTLVVSAGDDGTARVWDIATPAELPALRRRDSHNLVCGAFTPGGPRVVTADSAGTTAKVWNPLTAADLFALTGHTGEVAAAAFSPDGSWMVTGSADKTARIWDARTGAGRHVLRGHSGPVSAVAFSLDGARVVTGSADTTARIWDVATGIGRRVLNGHTGDLRAVAFSPDGTRVVTTGKDRTARVWDAGTGDLLLTLDEHAHFVLTAAFSPDGTRVLTGSFNTAAVWDSITGAKVLTLMGSTHEIRTASFSPDGTRVLTGGNDGAVRVWDAHTGAELLALGGHVPRLGVATAVFSADGSQILTVGADSTTKPGIIATAILLDSRPVNREFLPGNGGGAPKAPR